MMYCVRTFHSFIKSPRTLYVLDLDQLKAVFSILATEKISEPLVSLRIPHSSPDTIPATKQPIGHIGSDQAIGPSHQDP